jgi:hypothetical protein
LVPKFEKKDEFIKVMKNDVLPILKKQTGFLEILPFVPEEITEKMVIVSLWQRRGCREVHAQRFPNSGADREAVPYHPITWKLYAVETSSANTSRRPLQRRRDDLKGAAGAERIAAPARSFR